MWILVEVIVFLLMGNINDVVLIIFILLLVFFINFFDIIFINLLCIFILLIVWKKGCGFEDLFMVFIKEVNMFLNVFW